MAVSVTAFWTYSPAVADAWPGDGRIAFDTADFGTITRAMIATTDAHGVDTTALLGALLPGDSLQVQVFNDPATYATFAVTGVPVPHAGYVTVPLTSSDAATDRAALFFVPDQMLTVTQTFAGRTFAVGDRIVIAQPFALVPANATGLVVGLDATLGAFLLFDDGTQDWFDDAALTTYQVVQIGTAPDYAGYVYITDLETHEAWRRGFFDPVWHPNPPGGGFSVFARDRGAPPETATFGESTLEPPSASR